GDVAARRVRLGAAALGGGRARGFQIDVAYDNATAAAGQLETESTAEAAAGSGDDCAWLLGERHGSPSNREMPPRHRRIGRAAGILEMRGAGGVKLGDAAKRESLATGHQKAAIGDFGVLAEGRLTVGITVGRLHQVRRLARKAGGDAHVETLGGDVIAAGAPFSAHEQRLVERAKMKLLAVEIEREQRDR